MLSKELQVFNCPTQRGWTGRGFSFTAFYLTPELITFKYYTWHRFHFLGFLVLIPAMLNMYDVGYLVSQLFMLLYIWVLFSGTRFSEVQLLLYLLYHSSPLLYSPNLSFVILRQPLNSQNTKQKCWMAKNIKKMDKRRLGISI